MNICALPSLDLLVRERLMTWPQRPPGLQSGPKCPDIWLRGRPTTISDSEWTGQANPFLKWPGSMSWRTIPDGLWFNFGGNAVEPFVDIFAIEACGTVQNLLDKRSRFAPTTQSMLAYCPVPWLLAPVSEEDERPRWRVMGVIQREPEHPFIAPVRGMRVLFGLKRRHYEGFIHNQVPQPHEFFAPMEVLTADNGDKDPALHALLSRASMTANFFTPH